MPLEDLPQCPAIRTSLDLLSPAGSSDTLVALDGFSHCPRSPSSCAASPFPCQHHPVRPERAGRRSHPLCPCTEDRGLPGLTMHPAAVLQHRELAQPPCPRWTPHGSPIPPWTPDLPMGAPHGPARPLGPHRSSSRHQAAPRPSRVALTARPALLPLRSHVLALTMFFTFNSTVYVILLHRFLY